MISNYGNKKIEEKTNKQTRKISDILSSSLPEINLIKKNKKRKEKKVEEEVVNNN